MPRIVIAYVDGDVIAGGLGLVAACDLVIASEESKFSLSEALWGLLPCCVLPYLARRVGYQPAYRLTLSTQSIPAEEAHRLDLVDYCSRNPSDVLRQLLLRMRRLETETVSDLKQYRQKIWPIDANVEQHATAEINRLMQSPRVRRNLNNYLERNIFPWESI